MNKIIPKPWGQETLLTESDLPYTAKILTIKAGCQLSLQYHDQKTETLTLISGQVILTIGTDQNNLTTSPMVSEIGYTIKPNTIHRLSAITNSLVFEASTPEKGTTFRLADDYHRPNETK